MLLSGKLNKIRTFALVLIFVSVAIMYLGFVWPAYAAFFFGIGMLFTCMSVGIYFWIGILSTQSVKVHCPVCEKITKLLGKRDQCMFCGAVLSLNPQDQPSTLLEKHHLEEK